MKTNVLDAVWLPGTGVKGAELVWQFQAVTRVNNFEVSGDKTGFITSIKCGNEEQLVNGSIPVALFPSAIGIHFPAMAVGERLTVTVDGFAGRLRPTGLQVS